MSFTHWNWTCGTLNSLLNRTYLNIGWNDGHQNCCKMRPLFYSTFSSLCRKSWFSVRRVFHWWKQTGRMIAGNQLIQEVKLALQILSLYRVWDFWAQQLPTTKAHLFYSFRSIIGLRSFIIKSPTTVLFSKFTRLWKSIYKVVVSRMGPTLNRKDRMNCVRVCLCGQLRNQCCAFFTSKR